MRILIVGGTGTIGGAVAAALAGRHEVVLAGRTRGSLRVDIADPESVRTLYARAGALDAVVCCAGAARYGAFLRLTDADFEMIWRSKLLGQINLVRLGCERLSAGGSFTLTGGTLAHEPAPGGVALSTVNAALEAFAQAAALELPRGLRINVVSPPWVSETLAAMGRDTAGGLPAARVATSYVEAIEGGATGRTFDPRAAG
jgi:NAD(P)-dependent dehydrogenase (short-subunit alcohol dehydrogenase family)